MVIFIIIFYINMFKFSQMFFFFSGNYNKCKNNPLKTRERERNINSTQLWELRENDKEGRDRTTYTFRYTRRSMNGRDEKGKKGKKVREKYSMFKTDGEKYIYI